MTYKHIDFSSSPTMRSLERVAKEKGWIKEEPLTKTAAVKTDLTPSNSLLDNVLKLCAGLRDRGFEKQASELEINLLNYKQAQTLYETTPEKGEDLVHAAHPQGSHKLEGLDAENDGAVVEDILDQHAKNLQMIEKKPTGKLASISEAIEAVKVAIGAPPLVVKRAAKVSLGAVPVVFDPAGGYAYGGGWSKLMGLLGSGGTTAEGASAATVGAMGALAGTALVSAIGGAMVGNALFKDFLSPNIIQDAGQKLIEATQKSLTDYDSDDTKYSVPIQKALSDFDSIFGQIKENYSAISEVQANPSKETLAKLKILDDLIWKSRQSAQAIWSWTQSFKDESVVRTYMPFFNIYMDVVALAKNYMERAASLNALNDKFANDAVAKITSQTQQQSSSQGGDAATQLSQNYQDLLNQIKGYVVQIQANRPTNQVAALNWLNSKSQQITSEQSKFDSAPPEYKDKAVAGFAGRLNGANGYKAQLDAFRNYMKLS